MTDAIDSREAFKLGFLQRCADEGLTPAQVDGRIKLAAALLEKRGGGLADLAAMVQANMTKADPKKSRGLGISPKAMALMGLVGLPIAAGTGLGMLGSKLQGDYLDPQDVERQELINQYDTLANRAKSGQL